MSISTTSQIRFAKRVENVPQSFIREILKVTATADMVSFAGGLPNPGLFPVKELQTCAVQVFERYGAPALQYAPTEGLLPLRQFIADRYKKRFNLDVSADQILITNGSQQALDLIGKLFLSPGDKVAIERPGYLGAIQCFSMFEARFVELPLNDDGVNSDELATALSEEDIKLFYSIPNFQNPTGISYSKQKREEVARIMANHDTVLIEDDPYGEIAFTHDHQRPIYAQHPNRTVLLGSFSKTIAPGLRLGWMVADTEIIKKATVLKQASDLHSGNLSQYLLHEYLTTYNYDKHLAVIREQYKEQCDRMLDSVYHHFPFSVRFTRPQGGMFCWLTLPDEIDARTLLQRALKANIIFVPGDPFYVTNPDHRTLRLNFSNVAPEKMEAALKVLGSLV